MSVEVDRFRSNNVLIGQSDRVRSIPVYAMFIITLSAYKEKVGECVRLWSPFCFGSITFDRVKIFSFCWYRFKSSVIMHLLKRQHFGPTSKKKFYDQISKVEILGQKKKCHRLRSRTKILTKIRKYQVNSKYFSKITLFIYF